MAKAYTQASETMEPVFSAILGSVERVYTQAHAAKRWSWRDAPDLMDRLTAAQNALKAPIDIMTFAGFCDSREELERHVVRYEQEAL